MSAETEKGGAGVNKRPRLRPLSKEAADARRPLPPEMLIDALHDRVHRDVGRGRAAKTVRVKRPSSDTAPDTPDDAVDEIMERIEPLASSLITIQRQAEAAGIFLADRELLLCPSCALTEDVTAHGMLITYRGEPSGEDTGLRFEELEKERRFRCPSCGTVIELPDDEDV